MRWISAVAAAFLVMSCGGSSSGPASPSPGIGSIKFAGVDRTFIVFRPQGLPKTRPVPLVIAMHGYTSNPAEMETMSNLDQLASEDGFVVVYPAGLGRSWNAGFCCAHNTSDDVGFISALIDRLVADQHIDRTRVLAAGMSNGAMMAQRLGCEIANKITAVLSVSGSLIAYSCGPSRPISVLEVHGDADDLVPLNGGRTLGIGSFPPSLTVMQGWASRDGCAATPNTTDDAAAKTYTWSPCEAGAKVVLVVVKGGAHSWFGPQDQAGEPDASRIGWDFFVHAPALS